MTTSATQLESFLTHRSFVRNLAGQLLRDPSDVDEVEQETWLSALTQAGGRVRDTQRWLGTVVRNHARNLGRRERRFAERERAGARAEAIEGQNRVVERADTAQSLVQCVMALSDPNRTTLLLRYYEELSVGQIAAQLGVSTAVVKGQLRRGLVDLRNTLIERGKDDGVRWRRDLAAVAAIPMPSMASTVVLGSTLLGLVAAAAIVVATVLSGPEPQPGGEALAGLSNARATLGVASDEGALSPEPNNGASETRQSVGAQSAGGGEVTLRIGDGFVFGDSKPSADGDRSKLDLYVQDIRHGVSLGTLAGGNVPVQTMTSIGLPEDPSAAFELMVDAPADLPLREVWLAMTCTSKRIGLGYARSRSGTVFKLCLLESEDHPEALKRTVRIAYEPVPTLEGGGVLRLPELEGKPSEASLAAIREALRIGQLIPGDSFATYIDGDFQELKAGPKEMSVTDQDLVISNPMDTVITIDDRVAVFAADGLGSNGSITLNAYGAVGVQGVLAGLVNIESYGYVYVDGPVTGEVNLNSYSTAVFEKGLAGTLVMNSYSDILIRGQITGTLDARRSSRGTLYLDGVYSEWQLEEMSKSKGHFGRTTLHVRSSDLNDGEHRNVGNWEKVIVGDPVWSKLGR